MAKQKKVDDEEKVIRTIVLTKDTDIALTTKAILERKDKSEIIRELIEKYIKE